MTTIPMVRGVLAKPTLCRLLKRPSSPGMLWVLGGGSEED